MSDETVNEVVDGDAPVEGGGGESQTYKVKVDGKEVEVGLEDLLKSYSLAEGANKRFEEASKLREEAEKIKTESYEGLRIRQLYPDVAQGLATEDEIVEFCDLIGATEEDRKALLGIEEPKKTNSKGTNMDVEELQSLVNELNNLKGELQGVKSLVSQAKPVVDEYNEKTLMKNIENALDKNSDLKYIIDNTTAGKAPGIKKHITQLCKNEVISRIRSGTPLNALLLESVASNVASMMKEYGTLVQKDEEPKMGFGGQSPVGVSKLFDSVPLDEKIDVTGAENHSEAFAKKFFQKIKKQALEG